MFENGPRSSLNVFLLFELLVCTTDLYFSAFFIRMEDKHDSVGVSKKKLLGEKDEKPGRVKRQRSSDLDYEPRVIRLRKIPGANPNKLIPSIEKVKIPVPPGSFELHSVGAFVGHCNSGKSMAMINKTLELVAFGSINRVIIMSPTYDQNETFKLIPTRPEDIYSGKRVLKDGISCIVEVENKIKDAASQFQEYEEYCKAFKHFLAGTATIAEETLVRNNLCEEPEKKERPRFLIILDDLSHTSIFSSSRLNDFNNMVLRHRHVFGIGVSIFIAVQTFTTGIPKALRQNITQFFLWATHDETQLKSIYEQVSAGISKDDFYTAFELATAEPHQFLTVDLAAKDGMSKLRKNFDVEIILQN